MIEAVGYRLIVKPDTVETTSKGGIVMVVDENLERAAIQFGEIVSVGGECWSNNDKDTTLPKQGDRVLFAKYAGRFVKDPETEEEFMVMNDTDILGVIKQ